MKRSSIFVSVAIVLGAAAVLVVSPAGRRLVFERRVSGFSRPAGKHAGYLTGVDGSGLRRLTPWSDDDGDNPDWSSGGKWVLFHSHCGESVSQSQYFLVHSDGTGRRHSRTFPCGTRVASASFSPDSMSIAFSKGPGGRKRRRLHDATRRQPRAADHSLAALGSAPDWGTGS